MKVLVFKSKNQSLAVDLSQVVEIAPAKELVKAESKPECEGLVNHRGNIIPIFAMNQPSTTHQGIFLYLQGLESVFGLWVDEVVGVLNEPDFNIQEIKIGNSDTKIINENNKKLHYLIDPNKNITKSA